MAIIEYLNVILGLNHREFDSGVDKSTHKLKSMTGHMSNFGNIAKNVAGAAFATAAVKMAADAETAQVSFEVLTGSAEKAANLMADFRRLDQQSPLSFVEFQKAAKTMLGFGINVDDLNKRLYQLSEISMGNSERFQSLALAFSQSSAAGRLMGQDVLQFVNAGFNPLQQISKDLNVSMADLKTKMEEGAISVDLVGRALDKATGEGGLFYKMNDRLSKTTSGQLAKLEGDFKRITIEIGDALIPVLREAVDLIGQFTKPGQEMGFSGLTKSFAAGLGGIPKLFTPNEDPNSPNFAFKDYLLEVADKDIQDKIKSIVHVPTADERKKISEMQRKIDEQEQRKRDLESLKAGEEKKALEKREKEIEKSKEKIENLRVELQLLKERNSTDQVNLDMKARAMSYDKKSYHEAFKMLKEIDAYEKAEKDKERKEKQEASAKAKLDRLADRKTKQAGGILGDSSEYEQLFNDIKEAAVLMNEGFLTGAQFAKIASAEARAFAEDKTADRRDTPTAMAGSVEAYKIFLERDQDRAKEREIAFRSEQTLKGIHQELKNRGVLGVARR